MNDMIQNLGKATIDISGKLYDVNVVVNKNGNLELIGDLPSLIYDMLEGEIELSEYEE